MAARGPIDYVEVARRRMKSATNGCESIHVTKKYEIITIKQNNQGSVGSETPEYRATKKYEIITSTEDLIKGAVRTLSSATFYEVALDLETTGLSPVLDEIRLISLRGGPSSDAPVYVVDAFKVDPWPLLEVLRDKAIIAHNATFDLAFLKAKYGFEPARAVCTQLLAQLFYAGTHRSARLEDVLRRFLGVEVDKGEQKSDWSSSSLTDSQIEYASEDVLYLHALKDELMRRLDKAGNFGWVIDTEMRMIPLTTHMTLAGMPVDQKRLIRCLEESKKGAERIAEELDEYVDGPVPEEFVRRNKANKSFDRPYPAKINWNGSEQVAWVFGKLGITLPVTNKGNPCTKREALSGIEHPLAIKLLDYRDTLDTWKRFRKAPVDDDGRMRATWKQIGARTGRMACTNPPLQGVGKEGEIRKAYVAPPGHKLIISDLSQIEVRVLAALTGDNNLIADLKSDIDIHRLVASRVMGKPETAVTKKERSLAKSLVFGLLYGQEPAGFAARIRANYRADITAAEAEERYWKPFFEAYPGVADWRKRTIKRFKLGKHRTCRTRHGRRRIGIETYRQMLNTPVQGGAADVLKAIAVEIYEHRGDVDGLEVCGLVHDEVICLVPEEQAEHAKHRIHEIMVRVGYEVVNYKVDEDKRVPVDAGTEICDSWAEKS